MKLAFLIPVWGLLLVTALYSEDINFPDKPTDKSVQNITEYQTKWAKDNYVGTDTVYFWVQRTVAVQTITTSTNTKIQFDKEVKDENDVYDDTNYRFVAPSDGLYGFASSVHLLSLRDGGRFMVEIWVNGSQVDGIRGTDIVLGAADNCSATVSGFFQLNKNDYVEIYILHTHGSDRSVHNDYQTWFQGARIR